MNRAENSSSVNTTNFNKKMVGVHKKLKRMLLISAFKAASIISMQEAQASSILCPKSPFFPIVIGYKPQGDSVNGYSNLQTVIESVDVDSYYNFALSGGYVYHEKGLNTDKLQEFDSYTEYCGENACTTEGDTLQAESQARWGMFMVQSMTSYADQSTYMLHKSSDMVWVKGVRSLNLDKNSAEMSSAATLYNIDKDKRTLAAILVQVNSAYYIKIISIDPSDNKTRVWFVKEYDLNNANSLLDNDYTQNRFNFSFMRDNNGIDLGPTVSLSLCHESPCRTDIITQMHGIAYLHMTSTFTQSDVNAQITILGSKAAEDYGTMYFFGYYVLNGDATARKPIMYKVQLSQTESYFRVMETYVGDDHDSSANKSTSVYLDLSFLGLSDGSSTQVLLRSTTPEGYANLSGIALDVVDTFSSGDLITLEIDHSDNTVSLDAKAIKCGYQQCSLMIRDAHQLIFLKVILQDLSSPSHTKIINVKDYTPLNRVGMVPVAFDNSSNLDAFFALPTAQYQYKDGSSWTIVDFGSNGKVSIFAFTQNADCLTNLFDDKTERTLTISSTNKVWTTTAYKNIGASLEVVDPATPVLQRVDTWSEFKRSATTSPDYVETPWSDCHLEYLSGDRFDPRNDQTYRFDFRYTESTTDNKLKVGPMRFISKDETKECLENVIVDATPNYAESLSPVENVDIIGNLDEYKADPDYCLSSSYPQGYCYASQIYLAMQQSYTFVWEGDDVFLQYDLPVDSKDYDGVEIEYGANINAISARHDTKNFRIKWSYGEPEEIVPDEQIPQSVEVEVQKAFTQLDAPFLMNNPFGQSIEVELGQLERIELGQPTSTLGSQDNISMSLFVNEKLIELESCTECPIQLENTDVLIEATDYAFEVYNPYAVKNETIEESTQYLIKQQTLEFKVLLNCFSSVTLLETSYSFFVEMKREIVEEFEPEVITEAENSTSDLQGNVTTATETTGISKTVTETNSTTTNTTIANNETDVTANTGGSDGTSLDLDKIDEEADKANTKNSTEIKAAVKLFTNVSIKQVSQEIANVLDIKDINQTVESTQKVFPMTPETDIKEAQSFSIFDFLNSKGINNEILTKPNAKRLPNIIVQNQLKGDFSIPVPTPMFRDGSISFQLSKSIESLDFEKALAKFMSESDERRMLDESESLVGYGNFNDDSEKQKTKLEALTQLLKLTQSIQTELIPGSDFGLDKKGYTWSISSYEEKEIILQFNFEHPFYISVEKIDVIQITFNNTSIILSPKDLNLKNLPNGFTQVIDVPPQGANVMSKTEIKDAQTTAQTLVFANIIGSIIFKQGLTMVFSSIITIQILAHFALADIYLPANAKQSFDIMVTIVSFDLFQPTEYIDFGFSDTPPFSPQFAELDYQTINFVDCMGSILIFFTLLFLYLMIVGCLACLKVKCCKKLQSKFKWKKVEMNAVELINGTFFEVLVCVSISMQMLQYQEYLNKSDMVSVALQFVFAVVLALYILAVVYFSVAKVGLIVKVEKAKLINQIQQEQIEQSVKESFNTDRKLIKKYSEGELLERAKEEKMKNQKFLLSVTRIEKKGLKSIRIFKPLTENLRPNTKLALLSNLFTNIRRLTQLYMAMFVKDGVWLQTISFVAMNLLAVIYLLHTMPYKKPFNNYLNIMNELASLTVSYFILMINGLSQDPDEGVMMAEFINYTLFASWSMNLLLILSVLVKEIKYKARKWYFKKGRWRYSWLQTQSFKKQIQEIKRARSARKARKLVEMKNAQTQTVMLQQVSESESESSIEDSLNQLVPLNQQDHRQPHKHKPILINPRLNRFSSKCPSRESMELMLSSSQRVRSEHFQREDISDIDLSRIKDGVSNQNYPQKKVNASSNFLRALTDEFSMPHQKTTPQQRANEAYAKQSLAQFKSVKSRYRATGVDIEDVIQDYSPDLQIQIESPRENDTMMAPEMIVQSIKMIDTSAGAADKRRKLQLARTHNNSHYNHQDMINFSDAAVGASSIKSERK